MEGALDEKGDCRSGVGDAGAVGEAGLECRKGWTLGCNLGCNAKKDGSPSAERREGLGCARRLWGMTGIKDGRAS